MKLYCYKAKIATVTVDKKLFIAGFAIVKHYNNYHFYYKKPSKKTQQEDLQKFISEKLSPGKELRSSSYVFVERIPREAFEHKREDLIKLIKEATMFLINLEQYNNRRKNALDRKTVQHTH